MIARNYRIGYLFTLAKVAIASVLLWSCAEDNELSGSLEEVYQLHYDMVRVRLYTSEFAVEYLSSESGVVPVRLTLDRKSLRKADKELESGQSYDLERYGDITGRQSDGTDLFRFSSGTLHLDAFKPEQDAEVRGSFDAKFRVGDDSFTLTGNFLAELELVAEPNMP